MAVLIPFGGHGDPPRRRSAIGLTRIALALRQASWRGAGPRGLTPTQGLILTTLHRHPRGQRLSAVAAKAGQISPSRMCVTCRYFRPRVHADPLRPHHCAFVDAAFGARDLRVDCGDHVPASAEDAARTWEPFARAAGRDVDWQQADDVQPHDQPMSGVSSCRGYGERC
jgi:hypothetical protein